MKMLLCSAMALICALASTTTALRATEAGSSTPTVMTPYGAVSGTIDRGTAYSFKGVPYAAPPVGALRFADTQEVSPWNGTYDGSNFAPGCVAPCPPTGFPKPKIVCTPTVSEDCLYLNIYTPTLNSTANLPVMMFIHGGNFMYGSGGVPMFDGSSIAQNQSIVVVTINYRLGAFGGLHTDTLEGNYQIKDQRQAMRWIKKSIAGFGGNPNRLILSGQSAGATSMTIHMASPPSWGLFDGVIIESFPASLISPTPSMALTLGKEFLKTVGCTAGPTEVDCLRALSPDVLLNASMHTQYFPWPDRIFAELMRWQPIEGTTDLPMQPIAAMRNGNVTDVPVFIGTNANETAEFIYPLFKKPIKDFEMDATLIAMFGLKDGLKVIEQYGKPPADQKDDVRPFMTNIATDYLFYCPTRYYAGATNNGKATSNYVYFFDKAPNWNAWFFATEPWCIENVCHASDVPFWTWPFGSNSLEAVHSDIPQPNPDDRALSNFVQTAWGNFVNSGNPSMPRSLNIGSNLNTGYTYKPFNQQQDILLNSSTPVTELHGYRENFCKFWDTIGYTRQ